MTKRKFLFIVFLVAAAVFAVFVWPTRYKQLQEGREGDESFRPMRVDRLTHRVEVQRVSGEWVEHTPPPPAFDPMTDTEGGRGVSEMHQAERDIRKMNEVTNDVIKNGTTGKTGK